MTLYVLFAEHRTGHHAVLNWICKQRGGIVHHNNPELMEQGAYYLARRSWDIGTTHYPGREHDADLINLEGLSFDAWERVWLPSNAIRCYDELRPMLVIRRFRNWLASTACHPGNACMFKDPSADMMLKWDRMMNNYREHIHAAVHGIHPFRDKLVTVGFDTWFRSPAYRCDIAHQLDIPFTDAGLNDVPRFADGSTFDHQIYHERAQEMKVLERWRAAEGNPLYEQKLREHADLDELSEAYFA